LIAPQLLMSAEELTDETIANLRLIAGTFNIRNSDNRKYENAIITDKNMSVLLDSFSADNPIAVQDDDEIGAFNTDGRLVCVCVFDFANDRRCGLAVWGDDETTEEIDGLRENEEFFLKFWSRENQTEYNLVAPDNENLIYETNGLMILENLNIRV